jgi:hypothetical protein
MIDMHKFPERKDPLQTAIVILILPSPTLAVKRTSNMEANEFQVPVRFEST